MDKNLERILSYSLDQLDVKEKEKFDVELERNPELDQELLEMQSILEAIALAEAPMTPSENLKKSLLASLNHASPFHGYVDRFMNLFDLERGKVEALFDKITNQSIPIFKSCGIPRTSLFYFDGGPKVGDATCGIVKVKAGGIFPAHKHQGKEWVFVLQGTAVDQSGLEYLPGDSIFSDESVSHSIKISHKEDLIFAVVLEKPNQWLIGTIIMDYLFSSFRFR